MIELSDNNFKVIKNWDRFLKFYQKKIGNTVNSTNEINKQITNIVKKRGMST